MIKYIIPVLAASVASLATPADAASCMDRARFAHVLEEQFGEELVANSEIKKGNQLEVYSSREAKSWSLVLQLGDRSLACLVAAGRGRDSLDVAVARYH